MGNHEERNRRKIRAQNGHHIQMNDANDSRMGAKSAAFQVSSTKSDF